jgi:hypothetical protein
VVNLLIDAIEGVGSFHGPAGPLADRGECPEGQLMPTELIVRRSSQRRLPRTTVHAPRDPGET